ncbi:hypothetical protein I4U23_004640 [Adineta vaga]|nr:hypothetical protein I4U23_004640 [Adineta vaga]
MNSTFQGQEFLTHAVDLSDSYAILIGCFRMRNYECLSVYIAVLVRLRPLQIVHNININDGFPQDAALAMTYNRANDMSVSLNPTRQLAFIGLPVINKVVLVNINTSSLDLTKWTMNIIRVDTVAHRLAGFGRSIAWVNDNTVAIAVLEVSNLPWSQSEVWVFEVDEPFKNPFFVFPNSQQRIVFPSLPLFLQIASWSGNLLIFTDQPQIVIVLSQKPGFFSKRSSYTTEHCLVFEQTPCIPGMFKNTCSFGPCTICPPQTKNKGAINDMSLDIYPSYIQTFSYPKSPITNNYDDLLFFMTLPKLCSCPKAYSHRKKAKNFLKKADIYFLGLHFGLHRNFYNCIQSKHRKCHMHHMTVDLLNTAADCSAVTVQQNRPGVNYLLLPIISCVVQPDNVTRTSALHLVLIKVINKTEPLETGSNAHYSGRGALSFIERSLSDKLIYEQYGHHLRYISERTVLSIILSEQPFYLQNTQQPIVHKTELSFHTLLFCTLIIELFAMGFLVFRLIIIPLVRLVLRCCQSKLPPNDSQE